MNGSEMNSVTEEYHEFCAGFRSVMLTTISQQGVTDSSYEDFVRYDEDYYVYISELGDHTCNLFNSGKASLIFIDGAPIDKVEPQTRRVVINAASEKVDRSSSLFRKVLEKFFLRIKGFPGSILQRSDFHLFRMSPCNGVFVRRPGAAYLIERHTLQEAAAAPPMPARIK